MIGRIIEEEGQKVIQTLAGATAGTVCKVNYGSDNNYAIPITLNEAGEGYVGISCACPGPFYNPTTGTLTVDNICSTSSNAECADKVLSNSLSGDTVYNLAIWCATSDGNYNSMGFSGGRSITYNPYTATLNACCGNFANSLSTDTLSIGSTTNVANTGVVITQNNASIGEIDSSGALQWCGAANFGGAVTATCFCGTATNADNATTANNARYLSLCGCTTAGIYAEVGRSNEFNVYSNCPILWFNYRGGVNTVRIGNGCANGCLGTLCVNDICVGTGGITTCYDIVGRCDEPNYPATWYIYCNGEARFGECVGVCGCIQASDMYIMCNGDECEVISTATIGNYLTCQCRVSLETYLACTSLCSNVLYLVY